MANERQRKERLRRAAWRRAATRIERENQYYSPWGVRYMGETYNDYSTKPPMLRYLDREEMALLAWLFAAGAPDV